MAASRKTLFDACVDTLSRWTISYHKNVGTACEYALIAEPGPESKNKHLIIAIHKKADFPLNVKTVDSINLVDDENWEEGADKGVSYPVIGAVEDCVITLFCGEEHFQSFFDSTGRLLKNIAVHDVQRAEREVESANMVKKVEAEKKAFAKAKKAAKKERRKEKALAVALDDVESTGGSEPDPGVVEERQREKRRAKDARQKERRMAAAEEAERVQMANRERVVGRLQEQFKHVALPGEMIVDPATREGREQLARAKQEGWAIKEINF